MGRIFAFCRNYSDVVNKIYCTFKIEKNVYHKSFVIFSFFVLCYVQGTYSKHSQKSTSEADSSSVTQKSTT